MGLLNKKESNIIINYKILGGITMLEIAIVLVGIVLSGIVYPKFEKRFGKMK